MFKNYQNEKCRVISIVSGKGGCGKTLLTSIIGQALAREGLKVLLIDFDIFVRGLTILLSNYIDKQLQKEYQFTTSVLLLSNSNENIIDNLTIDNLSIFKVIEFFKCDFLPCCININEPFDYDQGQLSSFKFNKHIIEKVLFAVKNEYDIIIIDNRASIDSFVLAACVLSDVVISVTEDDDLCLQTNLNLINHLQYRQQIKNVYTIINKARRIVDFDDLKKESWIQTRFNYGGIIPFDMEILEDFGKKRFWYTVYETLYFKAVIDAWNNIAKVNSLTKISSERYRFPPSIFMSKKVGRFTLIERMMRIYSILLVFGGIIIFIYDKILRGASIFEVLSILCIFAGFILIFLSSRGIRRWLLGERDKPKVKN